MGGYISLLCVSIFDMDSWSYYIFGICVVILQFLSYNENIKWIDYRYSEVSILKFLKWKDDVIARINSDFSVDFIDEKSSLLANPDGGNAHWSAERFA